MHRFFVGDFNSVNESEIDHTHGLPHSLTTWIHDFI